MNRLIEIVQTLLGENGCPWDREQKCSSLDPFFLEEVHELLEAIDGGEKDKIKEELGDILHLIVFYSCVAEKEGSFSFSAVEETICEKLIRRHPHIFLKKEDCSAEEVVDRWEQIKKEEKGHSNRKSILDGLPPHLPLLIRARKMLSRIHKAGAPIGKKKETQPSVQEWKNSFEQLLWEGALLHIDMEGFLRKLLHDYNKDFRMWEKPEKALEHKENS